MADLEQLLTYLTLISVPIGVFYHILMLNNTRKNQRQALETRQAQLLMNIMNTFRSREFRTQWHIVFDIEAETFENLAKIMQKDREVLIAWTSVLTFFESVGVIVRNQMIDVSLIYSLMGLSLKSLWERSEHLILGDRAQINQWNTQSPKQDLSLIHI